MESRTLYYYRCEKCGGVFDHRSANKRRCWDEDCDGHLKKTGRSSLKVGTVTITIDGVTIPWNTSSNS